MTVIIPSCALCRHFYPTRRDVNICDAFPNGIPEAIIMGDNDHMSPYPGDNGILFEPAIASASA